MIKKLIDKIRWHMQHVHEMECVGYDEELTSSERQYWHIHECRYCPKRVSVMIAGGLCK